MNPSPGGAVRPPNKRLWLTLVAILAATGIGADCGTPSPTPAVPPTVTLTVTSQFPAAVYRTGVKLP